MVRYLLDSGLLIQHLRGQRRITQLMRQLGKSDRLAISTMTRLEIYAGIYSDEEYTTKKVTVQPLGLSKPMGGVNSYLSNHA